MVGFSVMGWRVGWLKGGMQVTGGLPPECQIPPVCADVMFGTARSFLDGGCGVIGRPGVGGAESGRVGCQGLFCP